MSRYLSPLFVVCLVATASQAFAAAQRATAIDGDTIKLGDEMIRLEGIDAPEIKQPCRDAAGKPYSCGRMAQRALSKLLAGSIDCKSVGKDQYDRTLAYCTAAGIEINRRMVHDGWA